MTGLEILKKIYQDLINDKVHSPHCICAACLYRFYKAKVKKSHIDKDNFFLYWLAFRASTEKGNTNPKLFLINKDLKREWNKILNIYYDVTSHKWRSCQFEKPDRPEHLRIISRYDKICNISELIHQKKLEMGILHVGVSPFLEEMERFLESVRRYEISIYIPKACFLSNDSYNEIIKKIKLAIKIVYYLAEKGEGEKIKHRDLLRRFKIHQLDLFILLDYLERKNLISWKKEKKRVSLDVNRKNAFDFFTHWLSFVFESLEDFDYFSLDAKAISYMQKIYG